MKITTRFAPSPTGDLHIGVVRTALYNWLYSKKHHGKFILRIEDTDVERSTESAVSTILDGLAWLSLDYHDKPVYQMQRMARYQEVIEQLLREGHAYKCYCSKDRLEELRATQMLQKQKPRYDGCCRNLTEDKDGAYVIRFKNPQDGAVTFNDLIHGQITVENSELDDIILIRSDGTPTYNFTVVIDDSDMEISHVIRGDDHINNTPRQINIYQALGKSYPLYAHVPMLLGEDGKKLSKRHGATSVLQFREEGYLPQALLNYLVRLGWSQGDAEIISLTDMIQMFSLDNVNHSPVMINPKKLLWLNHHYMTTLPVAEVAEELKWHFEKINVDVSQGPDLESIVILVAAKYKTLKEMAQDLSYLFNDHVTYNDESLNKWRKDNAGVLLELAHAKLSELNTWQEDTMQPVLKEIVAQEKIKFADLAQLIRIALTGDVRTLGVGALLQLLGKECSLTRIRELRNKVEN